MKVVFTILLSLQFFLAGAQKYDFPRDTSYTIRSAYLKIKKNYPHVTPVSRNGSLPVKEESNLEYSHPGRPLTLDIFYPEKKTTKTYPGVLLIYGGGWSSGEKANQVPMAQQLAAHGYVVAVAEYRLSPEARYPAAVEDLQNALRWMRQKSTHYQLDSSRIAVLGCSAGAQLATLLGVTGNETDGTAAQAIVNIDGIVSFIHPEAEEGTYAAKWLGGSRTEIPEIWKEASPLEYAGQETPPILFINSSQPRFHAGRDDMISRLDKFNVYSEVHTIEGSPHSFWLVHPWFDETVRYTVSFLDKILGERS